MNKTNAFALCASGVALLLAGVIIGMEMGKSSSSSPAATQPAHDREAERLEADAKLAEEIARRSAVEANDAREISRIMWEKFDRLIELNARENLYDSEKDENKKLCEQLCLYFGEVLPLEYDSVTGKVRGVCVGNTHVITPNLNKARAMEKSRLEKLQNKAVEDARNAAEKRMKCLEYAAKR